MKRKWKTNGLKRSIAVLMAAALVFTMQGSMGFSAEAGGTATTETMAVKKVLCENDYETATTNWNPGVVQDSSRDVIPQIDPLNTGNRVLRYFHSYYGQGAVFFGADYSNNTTIKTSALKAEAGKTYTIEYDYYIQGLAGGATSAFVTAGYNNSSNALVFDTDNKVVLYE